MLFSTLRGIDPSEDRRSNPKGNCLALIAALGFPLWNIRDSNHRLCADLAADDAFVMGYRVEPDKVSIAHDRLELFGIHKIQLRRFRRRADSKCLETATGCSWVSNESDILSQTGGYI